MQLTIVIPIYNERQNLPELIRRLRDALAALADVHWRVLFVDDGSSDGSKELILGERKNDPRLELLELSRNFGHQAAITAGLQHAEGDAVVVMDGDLQDPPEVIPELVAQWRQGAQVVFAKRSGRAERGLRRLGMEAFHRLMAMSKHLKHVAGSGVFVLLDRQAVEAVKSLPEQNRFLPGLWNWIGFERGEVTYHREVRGAGEPKVKLFGLVHYALNAHFSFSYRLLRLMTWFGVAVSCLAFGIAMYFVFKRILGYEVAQIGFTTLISAVMFLGGIQLIALGLVGEYIGRIYDEVKRRPLYLVRRVYRGQDV